MRLCRTCNGYGYVDNDICFVCNGEGIEESFNNHQRNIRKKKFDDEEYSKPKKKNKIDKKNSSRGVR
jgi:DnaJ-class molecular chaperone